MDVTKPNHRSQRMKPTRQKVADLAANTHVQRLELVALRVYPRRMVYSDTYVGPVAAGCGRDETGIVGLILWNEQIQQVNVGDIIVIESGWCREKNGELVVSTGKTGRLYVRKG